jgi:hypothetical protein
MRVTSFIDGAGFVTSGNQRNIVAAPTQFQFQGHVLDIQDQPLVKRYVCRAESSQMLTVFEGVLQTIALATDSVRIPLAEIYAGVKTIESPRMAPNRANGD